MNYVPVGKDGCMSAVPLLSPFLGSWLDCVPPNGSHDRVWLINYGGNDCIYFQIWFIKRSSVTFFHCLSAGCKESRGELGSEGMVEALEPWMLQSTASCHLSWIILSVINCNCPILLRLLIIVFFVVVQSLGHIWLFATPWTVARQASLSMGFSRQEYWSGLPFPSPGDLPNPGIEARSPALQADSLPPEPQGRSLNNQVHFWKSRLVSTRTSPSTCHFASLMIRTISHRPDSGSAHVSPYFFFHSRTTGVGYLGTCSHHDTISSLFIL